MKHNTSCLSPGKPSPQPKALKKFRALGRRLVGRLRSAKPDATPKLENIIENRSLDEPVEEEKKYDKHVPQHQLFINFHGEDVGFGFVSHLVSALLKKGVNVFIDDKYDERRDEEEDSGETFKKIEDSKTALVVFSSRYSESTWCLDELVKIKECMEEGKLKVIPIFYKVEPSHVQQLNGDFGCKLWDLWRLNRDRHIVKWKEALEYVASLEPMKRLCLTENDSEGQFVASIVAEVNEVLTKISLQGGQNPSSCGRGNAIGFPAGTGEKPESLTNKNLLLGIEKRMEQLEKKLELDCDETRIVGVVGTPGTGETTLAMMLHEKWNCKFVRCVPLLGIRKKAKDYGLVWLRTTLMKVLLGGEVPVINDETTHESVKKELLQTKVFVVLDDVSDKEQLQFLLGDLKWVKKGSKIVITTCKRTLLDGLANDASLVPQTDNEEAFQLISYHAHDDQISSPPEPEALRTRLKESVDSAGGNPLGGEDESGSQHNLQISNTSILDVWKFHIDQLSEQQRYVFRNFMMFLNSEDVCFTRSIVDSRRKWGKNAILVLVLGGYIVHSRYM